MYLLVLTIRQALLGTFYEHYLINLLNSLMRQGLYFIPVLQTGEARLREMNFPRVTELMVGGGWV